METTVQEQISELIKRSRKFLVVLPKNPTADSLGSSLALFAFLRKMDKEVELIAEKKNYGNLSFLQGVEDIKEGVGFPENYVISVKTGKTKIAEVSYDESPENLDIHLITRSGRLTPDDIRFTTQPIAFDVMFFLDVPTLEHFGDLYSKNTELFFNSTKVNIDNHIDNENYGNLNLVEITASATSEIVFALFKHIDQGLIDSSIATALLLGIVSETNSFQNSSTTPNSFLRASELINLGADHQLIVRHLYKTKPLAMLKVLGRAMARMKRLNDTDAVYSVINLQDIEKSEAEERDIAHAVKELIRNIPDLKLLFFAVEKESGIELYVHTSPNVKINEIVNHFGGALMADFLGKAFLPDANVNNIESILEETMLQLQSRLGL